MTSPTKKKCEKCGREVDILSNFVSGSMLPLEKVAVVYEQTPDGIWVHPLHGGPFYVSHFILCRVFGKEPAPMEENDAEQSA